MISFKEAASLTSSLLARKGSAVPAVLALSPLSVVPHPVVTPAPQPAPVMPQAAASPQPPTPPLSTLPTQPKPMAQMDGWRSPPPFQPARPPQGKPDVKVGGGPKGRPPRSTSGKGAKVSLRLDDERHRKLRLAAVHQQLSGQQILLAALDAYLAKCAGTVMEGNCVCINRGPAS
jgi:hypothetical protein